MTPMIFLSRRNEGAGGFVTVGYREFDFDQDGFLCFEKRFKITDREALPSKCNIPTPIHILIYTDGPNILGDWDMIDSTEKIISLCWKDAYLNHTVGEMQLKLLPFKKN